MTKKNHYLLIAPFFIMVCLFLLLPMLFVLLDSFKTEQGVWSISNYIEIFNNPFYTQSFGNSLDIAFKSTLIGLMIALIAAHAIHSSGKRLGKIALTVTNMASNFSGVPLAFAFMIILGNNGVITILLKYLGFDLISVFNLYSKVGLIAVYVYFQIPLGILLLYPAFDRIEGHYKEAAFTLGAGNTVFWRRIGIPLLLSALISTSVILFANAIGAYATAYALTNGAFNIVPVRIGTLVSGDIFLKPNMASALSVILASILLALNTIGRRRSHEES